MLKTHTILIVDDEEEIRRSLERVFKKDGYEVRKADGPLKALEILKSQPVAVVISDYEMPEMDGLTFLKRTKQSFPDAVRIILTGKGDMKALVAAINEGEVYRFVLKPWDNDELRVTVRRAIEQQELLAENRRLAQTVREQREEIRELEHANPGITKIKKTSDGTIIIDEDEVDELEKTNPGEYMR